MEDIFKKCSKITGGKFYLIGALKGHTDVIKHEIAHGMFYLNPEYKDKMSKLVAELSSKSRNHIFKRLKEMGYTKEVFIDETQAYLSTSGGSSFGQDKNISTPFIYIFKKYYKNAN
jgi:hypothetical protein